jgi:hypothetical protein
MHVKKIEKSKRNENERKKNKSVFSQILRAIAKIFTAVINSIAVRVGNRIVGGATVCLTWLVIGTISNHRRFSVFSEHEFLNKKVFFSFKLF